MSMSMPSTPTTTPLSSPTKRGIGSGINSHVGSHPQQQQQPPPTHHHRYRWCCASRVIAATMFLVATCTSFVGILTSTSARMTAAAAGSNTDDGGGGGGGTGATSSGTDLASSSSSSAVQHYLSELAALGVVGAGGATSKKKSQQDDRRRDPATTAPLVRELEEQQQQQQVVVRTGSSSTTTGYDNYYVDRDTIRSSSSANNNNNNNGGDDGSLRPRDDDDGFRQQRRRSGGWWKRTKVRSPPNFTLLKPRILAWLISYGPRDDLDDGPEPDDDASLVLDTIERLASRSSSGRGGRGSGIAVATATATADYGCPHGGGDDSSTLSEENDDDGVVTLVFEAEQEDDDAFNERSGGSTAYDGDGDGDGGVQQRKQEVVRMKVRSAAQAAGSTADLVLLTSARMGGAACRVEKDESGGESGSGITSEFNFLSDYLLKDDNWMDPVVVLLKNPFDVVAERMRRDVSKTATTSTTRQVRQDDGDESGPAGDNDVRYLDSRRGFVAREGFVEWCRRRAGRTSKEEQDTTPCRDEFAKLIRWYNRILSPTPSPLAYYYWEDLKFEYRRTVSQLMEDLEVLSYGELLENNVGTGPFATSPTYEYLFSDEQAREISRFVHEIATPETWTLLRGYFVKFLNLFSDTNPRNQSPLTTPDDSSTPTAASSSIEIEPKIAWLMSFPNSGAPVIRFVRSHCMSSRLFCLVTHSRSRTLFDILFNRYFVHYGEHADDVESFHRFQLRVRIVQLYRQNDPGPPRTVAVRAVPAGSAKGIASALHTHKDALHRVLRRMQTSRYVPKRRQVLGGVSRNYHGEVAQFAENSAAGLQPLQGRPHLAQSSG